MKQRPARRSLRRRGALAVVVLATFVAIGWLVAPSIVAPPDLSSGGAGGTRVVDVRGRLLRHTGVDGARGRPLPLHALGRRIVRATLVAEDRRFYEHDGFDERAAARAAWQAVSNGRLVSGASTITQQLVKITTPRDGERGGVDKLREIVRARSLERGTAKDAILEAYLNRLFYGHGAIGPEEAALRLYGVHARDLSWAQASLLAVLPRAPSYLDPVRHPSRAIVRQRALLDALLASGDIDEETWRLARDEDVTPTLGGRPFEAPHFVDTLQRENRTLAGAETRTTLDLDLQHDVERLASTRLVELESGTHLHAAVIVVDNATGDVLAYVGNARPDDPQVGQVDVASAKRQPGSTLKPFVYALSFEAGQPATGLVADVPTTYTSRAGSYAPTNFDGGFLGPVSARDALATSLNVPAIRLAASLGEHRLSDGLARAGFASLAHEGDVHGAAVALGSGEVSLRELAAAYVMLARSGSRIDLRYTAHQAKSVPSDAIEPAAAALVLDALSDPLARIGGPAVPRGYGLPFPVAIKTGTSSGYRDAWTVGSTRERTVAVWVGDATGKRPVGTTGAKAAGPLFLDVMRRAMEAIDTPAPLWDDELLERAEVCALSGQRPSDDCPHRARRLVPHGTVAPICAVHRRARDAGSMHRCDAGAPVVAVLPATFTEWLDAQGPRAHDAAGTPLVSASHAEVCAPSKPNARDVLRLVEPKSDTTFLAESGAASVRVVARSPDAALELEVLVDGRVQTTLRSPFETWLVVPRGEHEIAVRSRSNASSTRIARIRIR